MTHFRWEGLTARDNVERNKNLKEVGNWIKIWKLNGRIERFFDMGQLFPNPPPRTSEKIAQWAWGAQSKEGGRVQHISLLYDKIFFLKVLYLN